jgi:imidazolonepropionase-like amidohydrolase
MTTPNPTRQPDAGRGPARWARALLPPLLLGACATAPTTHSAEAAAGAAAGATLAFVGVNVIPMAGESRILPDHTVLVRDGRIAAVGPAREVPVPGDAVRIDAGGQYLLPGLADMHVHLEHSDDPRTLAMFLASGVTTVRNMDGRPYILRWREQVRRGDLPGPSIHTAGPVLDGDPPVLADNLSVRDAAEARAAVLGQAADGYDFVKVYANLSAESYQAVLETAREAGLPVAGHLPRQVALEQALRAGQHAIEHLSDLHRVVEADDSPFRDRFHWAKLYLAMPADSARMADAAQRIAESGAWAVPTLVERERSLAPPATVNRWMDEPQMAHVPARWRRLWAEQVGRIAARMDADDWEMLERGRENRYRMVRALHRAGAGVLVGTDTPNPFVVPGSALHGELAHLEAAGLPRDAVLAAATREAARFLGELEEWGTVEPGKRADLLLVAGNPLDDLGRLRRPTGVVARGRWYPASRLTEALPR